MERIFAIINWNINGKRQIGRPKNHWNVQVKDAMKQLNITNREEYTQNIES